MIYGHGRCFLDKLFFFLLFCSVCLVHADVLMRCEYLTYNNDKFDCVSISKEVNDKFDCAGISNKVGKVVEILSK